MSAFKVVLTFITLSFVFSASLAQNTSPQRRTVNITLKIGERTLKATLTDSQTTREFVSQLPLTLTLEDYASTEKIAYLPRKLSITGAPAPSAGKAGDITYYAPWGNLALFYKDFTYSSDLIYLGRLDGGVDALRQPSKLNVTIALSQ